MFVGIEVEVIEKGEGAADLDFVEVGVEARVSVFEELIVEVGVRVDIGEDEGVFDTEAWADVVGEREAAGSGLDTDVKDGATRMLVGVFERLLAEGDREAENVLVPVEEIDKDLVGVCERDCVFVKVFVGVCVPV